MALYKLEFNLTVCAIQLCTCSGARYKKIWRWCTAYHYVLVWLL